MVGVPKPRRGRGGGVYRTFRWMMSSGTGACSGKPNLDGWPAPNAWKGQTGTLTVQVHTGKTVAYPVLITEMGFKYDEKTQDLPDVFFSWEVTGAPTYTGWGSGAQPTATDPTKADQEQWEGTSKTYDTSGLQDSAITLIDIWGTLGDTDSAETTKLVAVVTAAAAPMTGQQKRTSTFTRDALDGGTITINWGLNTTQQDLEFEASGVLDDPTDLEDGTEIALVQTSATPAAPGTPAGLKVVGPTATKQLTPGKWLHTFRYGRRDNKDAIEQEGTYTDTDVSDLTSEGRQTTVYTTLSGVPSDPSPPSGLQIVSSRITVRNNVKSVKSWIFAKDTPKQKAEQARSFVEVDPSGIQSKEAVAQVGGTPSTPAGLVLTSTKTENLTNDHSITTVTGETRSNADKETFPRTRVSTDASSIEQEDSIAVIFTTGGSPTAPTRAGMVVAEFYDVPLTNAGTSNLSVRVYRMSYVSNSQRQTLPRYALTTDPNDLDSEKRSAVLWDSTGGAPSDPGLPSGLKLRTKTDYALSTTSVYQVRVYHWTKKDTADEATMARTSYSATSFLGPKAVTATIVTTTNVPSVTGNAAFAALKNDVTFEHIEVFQLNANQSLQIITTATAYKIVEGRSSFDRVAAPAYYDSGDVYVFMRQKIKIGTNLWQFELAEQYLPCTRIAFTISRRVSGSTLPYHSDLAETRNGSAFLGFTAGYVAFKGVNNSKTNLATAADRVSDIAWDFLYESLGVLDMADASMGWQWTTTDLTSIGPGWVKASDLGFSSALQGTGDYSVFIA